MACEDGLIDKICDFSKVVHLLVALRAPVELNEETVHTNVTMNQEGRC